eukprot:tig00020710_g13344.t1
MRLIRSTAGLEVTSALALLTHHHLPAPPRPSLALALVTLECDILHAVIPCESELDVPPAYVLKRKQVGWGDDGIVLVACCRGARIEIVQADKAERSSSRVKWRGDPVKEEERFRKELLETTDLRIDIVRAAMFKAQTMKMTFGRRVVMRLSLWQFKALLAVIKSMQTGLKNARNYGINKWMHMVRLIREFKGDQASYQVGIFLPTFEMSFEGFGRRMEMSAPFPDVRMESYCPASRSWHALLEPCDVSLEIIKVRASQI